MTLQSTITLDFPQLEALIRRIMTTYRQPEYEKVIKEIKEAEDKKKRRRGERRRELKVSKMMTNHPDMLTDKELHKVTTVFRSLENNEDEGTILPQGDYFIYFW